MNHNITSWECSNISFIWSSHTRTRSWVFLKNYRSILGPPQTCKCVYLKRVFIQIYFPILFTGSEELWLFPSHTCISSDSLGTWDQNFPAVTFFSPFHQNSVRLFLTCRFSPSKMLLPSSQSDGTPRTFIGGTSGYQKERYYNSRVPFLIMFWFWAQYSHSHFRAEFTSGSKKKKKEVQRKWVWEVLTICE